jgi:hypothetical protein
VVPGRRGFGIAESAETGIGYRLLTAKDGDPAI